MPLHKGTISVSAAEQSLKRKQPSLDENSSLENDESDVMLSKDLTKNRLIRSNDILVKSKLETLLEMLKDYEGIKDCSEETQTHLHMVIIKLNQVK